MRVPGSVLALLAWTLAATVALAEEGRWQALENNPSCVVWNANPQSNERVTWSGACAEGKAEGRGTQVWRYLEDGDWKESKYTGEMKDGKRHGSGVYVRASGSRYEGGYRDGKKHGRGIYVWASGSRYEGGYRDGKKHGRGVYVWADGDRYEGDFRDGKQHGRGVTVWGLNSKWAGDRYEGEYRDG